MLESLLIALIVATATVYAVWALTPATTRNRLALRVAAALDKRATGGAGSWFAARLRSLASAPASGCGNCPSNAATPAERASQQGRDGR
ncbi:MAG: hypothetical protein OEW50_01470 [Gammaproteobacteria bacterium]|nr:hypothetical protein [Gammaproteobacteria bacterium]MDH5175099.1 hypothetical protein [Gammaproteobacteria bacterium]MDH5226061.1 hypothetical protein [Gammaproteobacteria bacterium]